MSHPAHTARFLRFHAENPHVCEALLTLAREWRTRSKGQWSVQGIYEVLRWQRVIQSKGDRYRLNNDFRPFYARLIIYVAPDLGGIFEERTSVADRTGAWAHPDQVALWEEAEQTGWLEEAAQHVASRAA